MAIKQYAFQVQGMPDGSMLITSDKPGKHEALRGRYLTSYDGVYWHIPELDNRGMREEICRQLESREITDKSELMNFSTEVYLSSSFSKDSKIKVARDFTKRQPKGLKNIIN